MKLKKVVFCRDRDPQIWQILESNMMDPIIHTKHQHENSDDDDHDDDDDAKPPNMYTQT